MGDIIDIDGNNTLTLCFTFLSSKKTWVRFKKAVINNSRKLAWLLHPIIPRSRKKNVGMPSMLPLCIAIKVNKRVGHIAIPCGPESILLWGGYPKDNYSDSYCATNDVCIYNWRSHTWRYMISTGLYPGFSTGATGAVVEDEFFVFCGFNDIVYEPSKDKSVKRNPRHTNTVHQLNLKTLVWDRLTPAGKPPLEADKLASWVFNGKIYLFGGFGPSPEEGVVLPPNVTFIEMKPTSFNRHEVLEGLKGGWNNQLVSYDVSTNTWEWPAVIGDIPLPRAAHACVANEFGDVYLFGGKTFNQRLNDLYHLDLKVTPHKWTLLEPAITDDPTVPIGRSWHSLSLIGDYKGIIYGGFDERSLNDCWMVDFSQSFEEETRWTRMKHLERTHWHWHCAPVLKNSELFMVGGFSVRREGSRVISRHPRMVTQLRISPPPLFILALEKVAKIKKQFRFKGYTYLPQRLKQNINERRERLKEEAKIDCP